MTTHSDVVELHPVVLAGTRHGWARPVMLSAAVVGVVLVAVFGHSWLVVFAAAVATLPIGWSIWRLRTDRARSCSEQTGPPSGDEPPSSNEPPVACHRGCAVYSAGSLHEAQLLLDLLDEAGIVARLFNTHLVGAMGELPFYQSLPRIWLVDEGDLEEARAVIEGYEARRRQSLDEPRHCGACGEESPGSFELCWSCRVPFGGDD